MDYGEVGRKFGNIFYIKFLFRSIKETSNINKHIFFKIHDRI